MSDADNQTGGSGDPEFEKEPADKNTTKPSETDSDKDNDVMTDDDLVSGG